MKLTTMAKRLLSLLLSAVLLFGALPAALASASPAETIQGSASLADAIGSPALRKAAADLQPYVPPEGADLSAPADTELLQAGSFLAACPAPKRTLTPQAETAESRLVSGMLAFEETIDLSSFSITPAEIEQLFMRIINTHPEIFYVAGYYSMKNNPKIIAPAYIYTTRSIKAQTLLLNDVLNYILSQIPAALSDAEKALWVHEYLTTTAEYDYEAAEMVTKDANKYLPYYYSAFNVYGILVDGLGVCQGYALAFLLLMQRLGVDCVFVSSDAMNHAWNMVKLGGQWYHVDTTWDDPSDFGRSTYTYFLLSDAAMQSKSPAHYGYASTAPAAANSTDYENFFWKDAKGPMVYYNGKWCYVKAYSRSPVYTGNMISVGYHLWTYTFATAESLQGVAIDSQPFPNGSISPGSMAPPCLSIGNGLLCYTLYYEACSLDSNLQNPTQLFADPVRAPGQIVGNIVLAGQMFYAVKAANGKLSLQQRTVGPYNPPGISPLQLTPWRKDMQYKEDFKFQASGNEIWYLWLTEDEAVATMGDNGEVITTGTGATKVLCYSATGKYGDANLTVAYAWWQWLILIFLFGWLWY
ncbi:MAG: hypothetical protein LBJ11_07260 [Oscillospiraceae bacterium]|jgi:transglutaminase-like putative cysteine protease|nr:hypothetical protein [Oscillospiraceae bacterium]